MRRLSRIAGTLAIGLLLGATLARAQVPFGGCSGCEALILNALDWIYHSLSAPNAVGQSISVDLNEQAFGLIDSGVFCCTQDATFPGWFEPGPNSTVLAQSKVEAILRSYQTIATDSQTQLHGLANIMQLEASPQTTVITELRINTAVHTTEAQLLSNLIALETIRDASDLNWQAQEQARVSKFENTQP